MSKKLYYWLWTLYLFSLYMARNDPHALVVLLFLPFFIFYFLMFKEMMEGINKDDH